MTTPGQAHDLCTHSLIENADPNTLFGDKAYDPDLFVGALTQRGITGYPAQAIASPRESMLWASSPSSRARRP
jgi:hypothetical protein